MVRTSGNKGEWSELYAFFRLLSQGSVFAADENAERLDDVFYPITKVVRDEQGGSPVEYVINRETNRVDIIANGEKWGSVPQSDFESEADELLFEIRNGRNSFEITQIESFANSILVFKIKAPSSDKTDISLQIEDTFTNSRQDVGFSIKSELGAAPTLLNASKSTNFTYVVRGLQPEDVARINEIQTRTKIKDRMGEIYASRGSISFRKTANDVFDGNLVLIDSLLPEIVADLLLVSYTRDIFSLRDLVDILERENPRGYRRSSIYSYKIRKMLCACALGMKPSAVWDGREDANGGYIVVKESGEVLAYHIYNREAFELYLLNNTSLERASTARHDYLTLYESDGETRINLNLQIRFK